MFDHPTDHIRQRCGMIFAAAEADQLSHFALDLSRLDACADYVIDTIRRDYPGGDIPYHSRWRHFEVGGRDRWAALTRRVRVSKEEIARMRTELAIISVLLDAGAGDHWTYLEADSGERYARSEGLALASLHLYAQGAFSSRQAQPLRVDGEALNGFGEALLARAFQVSATNPLLGVNGRVALLRRLAKALFDQPACFGDEARLGRLFDYLRAQSRRNQLAAASVLCTLLKALQPIWPNPLGDVGRHPAVKPDGVVAFHKLTQWLCYSLLEPLHEAGIEVTELGALTGLPEYRNGGLFIDLGVLKPKHSGVLSDTHAVTSEVVVEWRALTVILLDRLAERIRAKLGRDAASLPLAKVLQGGSWSAGRRIAGERRDGRPPLRLASDGTVF